jgi:SH3 domain-containing YSC84-like protein 1
MNKFFVGLIAALLISQPSMADVYDDIDHSIYAIEDLMNANETSIPLDLMRAATCIANIRIIQAAFVFGGKGGSGLASCRTGVGKWSAPVFIGLGGGSWGFQIGVEQVDLTLVFTSRDAYERLTGGNFTLGANVGVTAGPVGRNASAGTNWTLEDKIFSYSQSRGLFAGISLEGSYLFLVGKHMKQIYGNTRAKTVLTLEGADVPEAVRDYPETLEKYSK